MAVKVRRERPDQRRHHRVTAPLFVDVEGWRLRAADWSLGGLRLVGFPEQVPEVGRELDLHLTLPFQGFDVAFDAKATVVRTDQAEGMFALKFTELGERERELMSHFIEELIRGSMTDIEDTINRIDVPVTPASLEPDPSPKGDVPVKRWPLKTVVTSAIYVALGLAVLGYTAVLLYANIFRLEVDTAVISAPVVEIKAQADGRIVRSGATPGRMVRRGEVLLDIRDRRLEREIELADIAVQQQKAKLGYLKRRQLDELQRAQSYAAVEVKNVKQTRLQLESLQARLAAAELQRNRLQKLHRLGYATDAQRDTSEKNVIALRKQVEEAAVELEARAKLAESNFGRRLYTGENVVGELGEIEAQVQLAANEVELSRRRREALLRDRERSAITAPFSGRVVKLPHENNVQVRRGDTVAVIERPDQKHITAFLTQSEVLEVKLGDTADVFVTAYDQEFVARVVGIDRTKGFLLEQEQRFGGASYTWRTTKDRSAEVTLAVIEPRNFQRDPLFKSGTPVVVVFRRNAPNASVASIRKSIMPDG